MEFAVANRCFKFLAQAYRLPNSCDALQATVTLRITWRQHLLAMALFAALLTLLFHRAIFFGEVLAPLDLLSKELPWRSILSKDIPIRNATTADVLLEFHSWKHFVHDELSTGRFPLWCRHLACGYPVAGVGVIKLFGLTTVFLWLTTPQMAALLTFFFQLFFAMTGMYLFLLALQTRWLPSVFGALTFGLNAALIQHLEFEHITGALMMLPWMCWALWRGIALRGKRHCWWAIGGLFFGLAILNGSLQSAAIVWMSAIGFFGWMLWQQKKGKWIREFAPAVAVFSLLGLALAAVTLWPNLELFARNVRPRFHQIDYAMLFFKRPAAIIPWLASLVNPDSVGNYQTFDLPRALGPMGSAATNPSMADLRVYGGLLALVFALLGLRQRSTRRDAGMALVLTPLIVALITPLYLIVYLRVLTASACGIAVLAAHGLERYLDRDEDLRKDTHRIAMMLVVLLALTLVMGAVISVQEESLTRQAQVYGASKTGRYKADRAWQEAKAAATIRNFTYRGPAVWRFGLLAMLVVPLLMTRRRHFRLSLLLVSLNTADLLECAKRTLPSSPSAFDYPTTPALEFLRQQPGLFRVVSTHHPDEDWPTASPNTLMPYQLDDARVYESLIPANPLLNLQDWSGLNVRYLLTPPGRLPPSSNWQLAWRGEVDIYENPQVKPRVSFVTNLSPLQEAPAQIQIEEYVSGSIRVALNASSTGWLLIRERSYPGWRTQVNGQTVKLNEAQNLWMAVPVEAGSSTVILNFRPRSVRWGGIISLVTLAGIGLFVLPLACAKKRIGREP